MPFASVNGADIHYVVSGAGEPLLLIPGLGLDHQYYRRAIPQLAEHVTVYGVDPRAIGKSTITPGPFTVEGWAEDFVALMDGLDLPYPRKIDFAVPGNEDCGQCPANVPEQFRGPCAASDQG